MFLIVNLAAALFPLLDAILYQPGDATVAEAAAKDYTDAVVKKLATNAYAGTVEEMDTQLETKSLV